MCGIVGILGKSDVSERIIDSLKKLEYRGYDSAGIATVHESKIALRKSVGKIANLEAAFRNNPISGYTGIGHTRWATHGGVEIKNAHPFIANGIALVHNGIIENHKELKAFLAVQGMTFNSDTDSEVAAKLIEYHHNNGKNAFESIKETFKMIDGAFAIAVIFASNDNMMIGRRKGAPLAVGVGEGEMYLGSDALALSPYTKRVVYLDDGEFVVLNRDGFKVYTKEGEPVQKVVQSIKFEESKVGKGVYDYYMLKEIHEQPDVIRSVCDNYYDHIEKSFKFADIGLEVLNYDRIYIIACGSSFHAASIAKYWIEQYTDLPVEIDYSSEFRYRNPRFGENALGIVISQSGETADTLSALRHMKEAGLDTAAIVNVEESTIAREAKYILPIYAGYEIGVASTKAFIAQLMLLSLFSIYISIKKNMISSEKADAMLFGLRDAGEVVTEILAKKDEYKNVAERLIIGSRSMIYMGRGSGYPTALEGALKIKEISYIHAEGMAAGELKHGCIALIDENMPVIGIAPTDHLFSKTSSNLEEIYARKGKIITLTDSDGFELLKHISNYVIELPKTNEMTAPIIYSIPLQLIAYYTAVAMGKDVDQPRNLAKSVTVE